jgi:hypothetical protein
MEDRSKYHKGYQIITRGLFYEMAPDKSAVLYSLTDIDKDLGDGRVAKSLKKLYLKMGDITEYDFAHKYFYNWQHWQEVANASWMKKIVAKWREELEVLIQADALKMIQAEAIANTKYSYAANRYLADKGWKVTADQKVEKKASRGAGRPSKAQVAEEANRMAMEAHSVEDDLKRLGLN